LARDAKYSLAETQAEAAVHADSSIPEAHELWGNLLARRAQSSAAVREFEAAIRLQPSFALAHFELAAELAKTGHPAAAIPHLKEAARSTDPAVRNAALQGLKSLGGQP
jgi:tetratricopeptide (TPR) repeat protein